MKNDDKQKDTKSKLIILILCIFLISNLFAQQDVGSSTADSCASKNEVNQAVNFCPGGIIFGIYAINYEYLAGKNHGLVARFDYESVSETLSNDKMEASGYAYTFNYRWHFSETMESFYVGSYVRYKLYNGDATDGATKFDFTLHEYTLGLNAGKRWVWNSGFNINCAFGYGISKLNKETDPTSSSIDSKLDEFIDDYTFIDPFYGEISIGYAF
ncbi:MAG: DUF3575 domain-containing protein [Ignavibacteriae bacterium]|nr:DUF3575 domain-containing protein [Ignavibacteriota bacterium]